jgi:hypothetical protein
MLKHIVEGGTRGVLLGDSAYPLREYMLTPYKFPQDGPQEDFNRAHRQTRSLIERDIGVIKQR